VAAHDDRKDRLEPALVHASTVYGLFVTQRQNLVSFYLVALGFLSAAYVAALRDRLRAAAVAVCALGAAASAAAILQDRRLRQLMRAAEEALRQLQRRLAAEAGVPALEILARADAAAPDQAPAPRRLTRGQVVRVLYGAVGLLFCAGAVYAAARR
jgi:hypothetical protein